MNRLKIQTPDYTPVYRQRFLRHFLQFLLAGLLVYIAFLTYNDQLYMAAFIMLLTGAVWLCVWLLKKDYYDLASSFTLLIMLILLAFMIMQYGLSEATIFWFFLFPLAAAFLKGNEGGSWWLLTVVLIIVSMYLAQQAGLIEAIAIEYDNQTFLQLVLSIFILAVFVYFYQDHLESSQRELSARERKLQKLNEELNNSVALRRAVTVRLAETLHNSQERNARDEALLDSIGEGVFAVNEKGQIIMANHRFEKIFGFDRQSWYKLRWHEILKLVDDNDKEVAKEDLPISQVLGHGKQVATQRYSYETRGSEPIPVAIIASPLIMHGRQIGAIEVFRDISTDKAINKAKDEFVSLASHQLRTPLSAIKWYSERLLAKERLSKRAREYVTTIYEDSTSMSNLVGDYLNVSRIELERYKLDVQDVDMVKTICKSLEEVKPLIEQKRLKVKINSTGEHLLKTDLKLLSLIISNLISNAIKYTPAKGDISISVSAAAQDKVSVSVSDTGIGIPAEDRSQIFNKLFRASNVLTSDIEGTGLGLYSAQAAAQQLNGVIEFKSSHKGTTFTLVLPTSTISSKSKYNKTKQEHIKNVT